MVYDKTLLNISNWMCLCVCQEAEIANLEAEIAQLHDPQRLLANGIISPQLEALRAENAKLKFQVKHLERVTHIYTYTLKLS